MRDTGFHAQNKNESSKKLFSNFKHLGGAFQVKLFTDRDRISFLPRNISSRNFHELPHFKAVSTSDFFHLLHALHKYMSQRASSPTGFHSYGFLNLNAVKIM